MSSPPNPKKPKVSSSCSSEDEEPNASPRNVRPPLPLGPDASKPRYKKRKIAIFFGYCGHGYQGMQKNPGAKTIESDLEEALYLSFAVPESDRGLPRRYDWARSARTDKGVSAAGQVVSGRFYVDPPGLVDRLNAQLSPQIRIFGYKRVTASFNAKKFCDRRRYCYLLPVFALDPEAHPDRESVMASFGTGNELTKCLECSERGRKVPGLMGRGAVDVGNSVDAVKEAVVVAALGEVVDGGCSKEEKEGELSCDGLKDVSNGKEGVDKGSILDVNSTKISKAEEETPCCSSLALESQVVGSPTTVHEKDVAEPLETSPAHPGGKFKYGEKEKERFNAVLRRYVGTHNFHNFTTRTKPEDPSARRYIVSFDASTVVDIGGINFVRCEVVGQSFMLHQIRKMIGLAVAIMRNCTPDSIMDSALRQDVRINVPTAPEVGLYLEECLFTSYNQKWRDTHEELSMSCYAKEAEEFKMKYIYSHIASMEQEEGSVALWLHSLNHRNYPAFRMEEGSCNNGGVEASSQVNVPDVSSCECQPLQPVMMPNCEGCPE